MSSNAPAEAEGHPPRPPNAQKACVGCKRKKTRCVDSDLPGICARCKKMKEECIFPETHRPRKRRLLNSRVGQLEQNLEHIVDLLSAAHRKSSSKPPASTSGRETPDERSTTPETAPRRSLSAASELRPRYTLPAEPYAQSSSIMPQERGPDMIDQKLLSLSEAQALWERYKLMAPNFPYVIISPSTTLEWMLEEMPMLLRAMFVSAAFENPQMQETLEKEFLSVLTLRVFMEGQKSMDLLQSLLVYLSWFHFHLKPGKQQVYRVASLAVAILLDLGINRRPRRSEQQQMNIEVIGAKATGLVPLGPDFWPADARRAFIGCYVVTALYAILARKPFLMKYTPYLSACAASLEAEDQVPSDRFIARQLERVHYAENISGVFGYNESDQVHPLTDEQMEINLAAFSAQRRGWNRAGPGLDTFGAMDDLTYHILESFTHEVAIHGASQARSLAPSRVNFLITCLAHVKSYLDAVLALPRSAMRTWTTARWGWLNYSIILLNKLCTSTNLPTWNIHTTRALVKMEFYLDRVSDAVRSLTTETGALPHWYQFLIVKWATLRKQYMGMLDRDPTETRRAACDSIEKSPSTAPSPRNQDTQPPAPPIPPVNSLPWPSPTILPPPIPSSTAYPPSSRPHQARPSQPPPQPQTPTYYPLSHPPPLSQSAGSQLWPPISIPNDASSQANTYAPFNPSLADAQANFWPQLQLPIPSAATDYMSWELENSFLGI